MTKDPLDLGREAVVGHAVGLVEHDDVDGTEIDLLRLQEVDQPQRCGDHDLDPLLEAGDLVRTAGAAVHGQDAHSGVRRDRLEHLSHLDGELTRGHEHEAQGVERFGPVDDAREHRHAERQRLARSRAGPAADVVTGHRHRDGLGLDRERLGEAGGGQSVVDTRRHAEVGEPGRGLDRRKDVGGGEGTVRAGRLAVEARIGTGLRSRSPARSPAAGGTPPRGGIRHGATQRNGKVAIRR
jgi:hypothetical protein